MREPLYTAAEMRRGRGGVPRLPGYDPELMERAGGRSPTRRSGLRRRAPVHGRLRRRFERRRRPGSGAVLEEAGREVLVVDAKPEDEDKELGDPDVLIDALFGTGFEGEPRAGAAGLIERIDEPARRCSVSTFRPGWMVDWRDAGVAVDADVTVTFHGGKVGHYVTPGAFCGYVEVADIGLEPIETANGRVSRSILDLVPRRNPEGNKYTSGHVVVVGGSRGMTGAPCLSALAAFRSTGGYVTLVGPEPAMQVFEHRVLEAVKRPLSSDGDGLGHRRGRGHGSRAGRESRRACDRPWARAKRGHEGARVVCSRRRSCRPLSTETRSGRSSPLSGLRRAC